MRPLLEPTYVTNKFASAQAPTHSTYATPKIATAQTPTYFYPQNSLPCKCANENPTQTAYVFTHRNVFRTEFTKPFSPYHRHTLLTPTPNTPCHMTKTCTYFGFTLERNLGYQFSTDLYRAQKKALPGLFI